MTEADDRAKAKAADTNQQNKGKSQGEILAAMRNDMDTWHDARAEKNLTPPPAPRKKKQ